MSTHVHRDGAHKIIVQDEAGREVTLISQDHTLDDHHVGRRSAADTADGARPG